jgi:hypothetical protein
MEQGERRMTTDELKKEAEDYLASEDYFDGFVIMPSAVAEAYIKGAEPREKRIKELEAEVKEWKDKADLWCKTANLKDHNIMINKELEKENAELKADNDARKFAMAMSEKVEKQLREENAELKVKVGLSIDCEKAQKDGELCLGYGGDEDEPCEHCKNCIKCECGYYQLGETDKDEQLTKAKEIIREFVEWATWQGNSKCPSFKSIQDKAEQFLSEVEK